MGATPLTILHVDDNEITRYAVSRSLRHAGFDVWEATNGAEALQLVQRHPDLVLLDVNLPDLNGMEVCRQIRADPLTADVPVVHLTASAVELGSRVEGLEGGADGYVIEPVEPEELIAMVRAVLRVRVAERQARAAQREWQATFDALGDAVAVLDRDARVLRANRALAELVGRPAARLAAQPLEALVPGLGLATLPAALAAGERVMRDIQLHGRHFRLALDPMVDDAGRPAGAVCVLADITARVQAAAATREAQARAEQAARAAELNADRVSRLQSVTATLAGALSVPQVVQAVVQEGASTLGAVAGALMLLSEAGQHLELAGSAGYRETLVDQLARLPVAAAHPLTDALRSGAPLWIESRAALQARYPELVDGQPASAIYPASVVIPLAADRRPLGVLTFSFAHERAFSPEDRVFLLTLARQCGEAVERARLYEAQRQAQAELEARVQARTAELEAARRRLEAEIAERQQVQQQLERLREEERNRIARELHDELGGALTALKMELAGLTRPARAPGAPAVDPERLSAMHALIDNTVDLVRRIAADLRPSLLDNLGLPATVEWQLEEFERATGIQTYFTHAGQPELLDDDRAVGLYRVLREALTNIARHAHARQLWVSLEHTPAAARLTVRDDGCGFDPAQLAASRSLGLVGMRERVMLLGGRLTVESQPGQGTRLLAEVPLE